MTNLKVRAVSAPWHNGIEMIVQSDDHYGTEVIMKQMKSGSLIEPTISITIDAAQILMDDLWNSGIRPTEGTGSAGSLKATQRHLSDMREIAFNKLEMHKNDEPKTSK